MPSPDPNPHGEPQPTRALGAVTPSAEGACRAESIPPPRNPTPLPQSRTLASEESPAEPRPAGLAAAFPELHGYELLDELGRGGMGVVYRARQTTLNRFVALKMVQTAELGELEQVIRFRLEGEAIARLRHPNIVQVHEIGAFAGRPCIVFEYVDGGSLADRLKDRPQPPRQAAELIEVLARAVHHAHLHGIIHRDLKPGNVLLQAHELRSEGFGVPKITDFGLAKEINAAEPITRTGYVMGTPTYMAPEQISGTTKEITPAVDVYALGVLFYVLLTGAPPFQSKDTFQLLRMVVDEEPVPPSRRVAGIPRDLECVCLRCLEKSPQRRYASAEALADDLRRYLDGEPVRARPVGSAERFVKLARRRPLHAAVIGLALFIVLVGFPLVTALYLLGVAARGQAVDARNRAEAAQTQAEQARDAARSAQSKEAEQRKEAEQARDAARTAQGKAEAAGADARRERDRATTALYFSHIAQARLEWRLNNMAGARQLLGQCPPDRRGWEWNYLQALCQPELLTIPDAHTIMVCDVAFTPDGHSLISAGGNPFRRPTPDAIRVWDAATGARRLELPVADVVFALAVSPDGRKIAFAGNDREVRVCDVDTGRVQVALPCPAAGVRALAFSPDGGRLAVGLERRVPDGEQEYVLQVWDIAGGKLALAEKHHAQNVRVVLFSPDGKCLASATPDHIWLWEAQTGRELRKLPGGGARGIAFSPDSRFLAAGGGFVRIWDVATGRQVSGMSGHAGETLVVAFSPDGAYLATGGADNSVRLWDARSGAEVMVLRGHAGRVGGLAFHPNGRVLASAGQQPAEIKLWDLTRQPEYLSVGGDRHMAQGGIVFLAGGSEVATLESDGTLSVYDVATGLLRRRGTVSATGEWLTPATLASWSGDGRRMVVIRPDRRSLQAWDMPSGKALGLGGGCRAPLYLTAMSADGRRMAAAGNLLTDKGLHREIQVWDTATGRLVERFLAPVVQALPLHGSVALSADGRRVAFDEYPPAPEKPGFHDSIVRVVNLDGMQPLPVVTGHQGLIQALAFRADGELLASADRDGVVLLSEVATGKQRPGGPLQGPESVAVLAFSPDGRRLASTSREYLKLWDVASAQEILSLRNVRARPSDMGFNPRLAWSPDGRCLAALTWDKTICVWAGPGDRTALRRAAAVRTYSWHLRSAAGCLDRGDEAGLTYHVRWLRTEEPPDPRQRLERGELEARLNCWDRAATDYAAVFAGQAPDDAPSWLHRALFCLAGNDPGGYRQVADRAAQRLEADGLADPLSLVRACCLLPPAPPEAARLVKVMEVRRRDRPRDAFVHAITGLARLRAGQFQSAVTACRQSLQLDPKCPAAMLDYAVLAIAYQRLGNTAAAKKSLNQATTWLEQHGPAKLGDTFTPLRTPHWAEWQEGRLLRREAEKLLRGE